MSTGVPGVSLLFDEEEHLLCHVYFQEEKLTAHLFNSIPGDYQLRLAKISVRGLLETRKNPQTYSLDEFREGFEGQLELLAEISTDGG